MDTGLSFRISDPIIQRIYEQALIKCKGNEMDFGGRRVLIEGGGYRKIWLETQPMGGEMYARVDREIAMNNQRFFIENQRADGRLPGSIACIDGNVVPQYDKFQGFCFPFPALNMFYWTGCADEGYLDALQKALEGFDAYLWRVRDSDGDGCLEAWCVFDTGDDNSTRYGDAPVYATEETPPSDNQFVPMESGDVMSFSYSARETLAKIAALKGNKDKNSYWLEKANTVRQKMRDYLWDDAIGALFDRDSSNKPIPALTHHTLRAMYWNSLSQDMADRFLKEHIFNPEEFWTPMPLPSIAINSPYFRNNAHNDWSGQPQGLTYQRAIRALENYGYYSQALTIGEKLLTAIGDECQFTQQFDPFTAKPSIVNHGGQVQHNYGPTMLACLEYIARAYGVSMIEGDLHFGMQTDMDADYTLNCMGRRLNVHSKNGLCRAMMDEGELFTVDGKARVITDREGVLRAIIGTDTKPVSLLLTVQNSQRAITLAPNQRVPL